MIKATVIGTGNFSSQNGASSIMVTSDEHPNFLNLFDCGDTVFRELVKLTDNFKDIENINVFITHNHADHIGSLASLILYCKFVKVMDITVYSYDHNYVELNQILRSQEAEPCRNVVFKDISRMLNEYDTDKIPMFTNNSSPELNKYYVTWFKTSHTKLTSVGYNINIKTEVVNYVTHISPIICFTGDINEVPMSVIRNVKNNKTLTFIDCDLGNKPSNVHTHISDLKLMFNKDDSIVPMHFDIDKVLANPDIATTFKFPKNGDIYMVKYE